MSANYLNNKEKFERGLSSLHNTYMDCNTNIREDVFGIVDDLKKYFNMYIDVKHEFYKDGANVLVQVLCVVDGEYVNELCSGGYGDNGEISDEYEAYVLGIEIALDLLKKYKINNKIWK